MDETAYCVEHTAWDQSALEEHEEPNKAAEEVARKIYDLAEALADETQYYLSLVGLEPPSSDK